MKFYKKRLKSSFALIVLVTFLCGLIPMQAFANEAGDDYSIANNYIKYTINAKTGGFCIETKDGHPQKTFDNQIPLLYKEDRNRSNGTSFTTIRIDSKDYIFGQSYGWFGIDTKLSMPVISEEGRKISVTWSIKGYDITQNVVVATDENNATAGNVGISYTISNNNNVAGNVGVRLMLDNALDNNIDAPYVVSGTNLSPTIVETEFTKEKGDLPQQIRFMDSVSAPVKMGYAILSGWSGEEQESVLPDKVIVGHWANLANTRYAYTADTGCDFSNYSNAHRTPDTASAYYWSEKSLAPNTQRKAELLYGVGNFSKELKDERLGVNMTVGKVDLDESGKDYKDGGKFPVTVTLDNTVSGARDLVGSVIVKLTVDEGLVFESTKTREHITTITGGIAKGKVHDFVATVIADKQVQITSKRVVVSINATEYVDESTQSTVEYSTNRNVLLPAVGGILPNIQMTQISPDTVYYDGEKNVTISGKMEAFKSLAGNVGWDLYLINSANEKILIEKSNLAFTDETFETMSFSTDKKLSVGSYKICFVFSDAQLKKSFGSQVTAGVELKVSADPKDRCVSYGIVAMVRFSGASHKQTYDFVSFANEDEMSKFKKGETTKNGLVHNNIKLTDSDEILAVVRGKLRQMINQEGKPFFQASISDGDITINNILTYSGIEPLNLIVDNSGATISGDGTIKVINSINIWHNKWSFNAENGTKYTLDQDAVKDGSAQEFEMSLDGAGSMIQHIAGFLINIKYGVLTCDDDLYNISFGGIIALPISGGKDSDGGLSAEITSILYGEKEAGPIGFVGIDTTLKVGLPENIMGSLVKNSFGVEAEVTINTIKNYYRIQLGVDLSIVECEGVIALKQVPINTIPRIVPDEISFKIGGDIMEIPIVPPFLSLTGIGGGIKELADTMSDDFIGELPPITLMLSTSLCLIETLDGDFDLELALSGFSLDGELRLRGDDDGKILKMNAGLAARWLSPFYINAYGSISVIDGLLTGGFTIKISDDYFYGYIFASLCIPNSVPVVGGMELAGVEAAVSTDFIGANVKIIGIKFGFIYYWEGDFKFAEGIDLSSRGGAPTIIPESYYNKEGQLVSYTGVYGANLRRLTSTKIPNTRGNGGELIKEFDPTKESALMLEVPLSGAATPKAEEIKLVNPSGETVKMIPNDNKGNGNFLVQNRGSEGRFLYITITDPKMLQKGQWKLSVSTDGVAIQDFNVDGVNNLPEITSISYTHSNPESKEITVSWTTDCESSSSSTIDLYVTKDANAFSKLQKEETKEDSNMASLGRIELDKTKSGSKTITIPDSFPEGDYYVVGMLSQQEGGMSKVISSEHFVFANANLPKTPSSVNVSYGGNNGLKIDVTDIPDANYDTYLVTVLDANGVEVPDAYGEYKSGESIYFNRNKPNTNVPILNSGEKYTVSLATRRGTDEVYYYSSNTITSQQFTMPKEQKPKLIKVESNMDPKTINTKVTQFTATYTFDQPVKFVSKVDGENIALEGDLKDVWTVDMPLEDGEHFIDFTAYNANNDSTSGNDFKDVEGSQFGFTVDSQVPVLTLGMSIVDSLKKDVTATVSNQTVFMNENGSIVLKGITEAGSKITLGGSDDGIIVTSDGSFTIERKADASRAYDQQILKAVDKAGNETSLTISIVNSKLASFDTLKLLADSEIKVDEETGLEYVELSVGETVSLSAYGKNKDEESHIDGNDVIWNVLYEQNIISMENGRITALSPGETAIRGSYKMATYDTAGMEGMGENQVESALCDVILVKVTDPGYRYSLMQTNKYTIFNLKADKTFGAMAVTLGDKTTVLLYDETKKAYVGAFDGIISSATLVKNMTTDSTISASPLILGDTDGNGTVTDEDIDATLNIFLKDFAGKNGDLNEFVRADYNGDGIINIIDAQLARLYLLKKN